MFDNGLQKVYVIFQRDSEMEGSLIFHTIYRDAEIAQKEVDRLNEKEGDNSFFFKPETVRI